MASKNKVSTAGYCIKRLRDNNFWVNRIFDKYAIGDPRDWTILINPERQSVFVTHYSNKNQFGESLFEFNDGGVSFPKNFQLKTDSVEVIINFLIEKGVTNNIL